MSTLIAATRPARRDVQRHPGRILAAVLLITIPVWFLAFVLVTSTSGDVPYQESSPSDQVSWAGEGSPPDLEPLLPEGYTAQMYSQGTLTLDDGYVEAAESSRVSGDDILLSRNDRDSLHAEPGATLPSEVGAFTYAGLTPSYNALVAPGRLEGLDNATSWWIVSGPDGQRVDLTREQAERLEDAGFAYFGGWSDWGPISGPDVYEILAAISGLLSLLSGAVVLLTLLSPAFTTSVSRQTRTFALMASQGASPRQLFASVLTYGFAAGLVGSTLGIAGGVLTAWIYWSRSYPGWPLVVEWWYLPLLWLAGVAASTVAAWLPAFIVSRTSIVQGLQGATNDRMMSWRRWMLIGPILLCVAAVACAASFTLPLDRWDVYGLLLSIAQLSGFLGVVLTAPAAVYLLSRFSGPLPLRLALRDLRRQSLRSVPAVAAIALIASVATFAVTMGEADRRATTHSQAESYVDNVVTVRTVDPYLDDPESYLDPETTKNRVEDILGPVSWSPVEGVPQDQDNYWYLYSPEIDDAASCHSNRCTTFGPSPTDFEGGFNAAAIIASPDILRAMHVDPAVADTEQVLASSRIQEGPGDFEIISSSGKEEEVLAGPVTLPIAPVLPGPQQSLLPTRSAVERLEVPTTQVGLIGTAEHSITAEQADELSRLTPEGAVQTLRAPGSDSRTPELVVYPAAAMLLIAVLVLALSRGPARRQKTLLDAVGAPPRLSSQYFALFGASFTFIGGLLGLAAGHVAGFILTEPDTRAFFLPSWEMAVALLIVVPVLSAVAGFLLSPRGSAGDSGPDRA